MNFSTPIGEARPSFATWMVIRSCCLLDERHGARVDPVKSSLAVASGYAVFAGSAVVLFQASGVDPNGASSL